MEKEILIYALPAGVTERYREELISSHCETEADIKKVCVSAMGDGYHGFRVTAFTPGEVPDFAKSVKT